MAEVAGVVTRNPVATSGGAGIGILLVWAWQSYAVAKFGQPDMPPEVAGVITLVLADFFRWVTTRVHPTQAVLVPETAEPEASK